MKNFGLAISANLLAAFASAANIDTLVLDKKGRPVADAIVMAKNISAPLTDNKETSPKTQTAEIVQIKQEFVPYVTVLPVGTQVNFPNNDTVKHHVYSFSAAKKFDLPLYSGKSAPSVLFDKPGIVVIGCNIHDWMIGYIYITDAPYFAKTDAQGKAVLKDLPAGKYTVQAWHPDNVGKEQSIQTDIVGDNIKQDWHLDIKPRVNPRHNAMPDMNTY